MAFADIIGQQRIIRLLRQALTQGRLPHAFLFTGMEGVGKSLTAFTLAKVVNCENTATGDCCELCLSCRKAASGNHPDINIIESEGTFIKIEQIRALKHRLRFRPLEGRYRVTIIMNGQNMKGETANALLKILEEPPADNLIIVTAYETAALLPTIVSRCLHLPFQPLTTADIAAHLGQIQEVSPEQAAMVAQLAAGSLTRAQALLEEKQRDRRRWMLKMVSDIHRSRVTDLVAAAKAWKGENADFREDLEWLKLWIRDLLVQQLESRDRVGLLNSDFSEKIMNMAPRLRADHLLEMFDLVCKVQDAISYNINKRLGLETLLLHMHAGATGRSVGPESMAAASEKGLASSTAQYAG